MSIKNYDWPDKTKGFVDFHENTFFWYGIPKIGKTTLASKFPDALFFLTEEGAKHVSIRAWQIKNWADFLKRLDDLETAVRDDSCPFKTIVIDTIDNLADFADQFICKKYSINILGDLDYGKGYGHYKREITKHLRRITQLSLGLVFISHAQEKEVLASSVINPYAPAKADVKNGKMRMIVPTLEKRAYEFISALADMIFYIQINAQQQRVIQTKPDIHFEAGDRSGRLPETVLLDYGELLKCYYGKDDDQIPEVLLDRLNKAEQYLAQHKVDGFDVSTRVDNSRLKHLETKTLKDASIEKLQAYLQHLRIKAKNGKKEKK